LTTSNLITGGAGFIGANLAERLLSAGEHVVLLDNLSRPNVQRNAAWLRQRFGTRSELRVADVRDDAAVRDAMRDVDNVFHFAAQVAVTTSLEQPLADFDVNAGGTLRVLEAARLRKKKGPPTIFFTSTNKVYGSLPWLGLSRSESGYEPELPLVRDFGISESAPLDFHSPYGCSKGCADQYVRDYSRSFGLRAVVFRMSCIYGPRQFGTEDQGWVAHLLLRALRSEPITIYGDGHQVRDLLFIGDLVEAFLAARSAIDACSGEAFNIGGGPHNAVSVLDVVRRIGGLTRRAPRIGFEAWRSGDQKYYVSDTRRFSELAGWWPRVRVDEGLARLAEWLRDGAGLVSPAASPLSLAERVAS
jgi:CDP-paratose 2-epimerase